MAQGKPNFNREKFFAEEAWLNYFNRYLYAHGTITEKEYLRMTEKIARRTKACSSAQPLA